MFTKLSIPFNRTLLTASVLVTALLTSCREDEAKPADTELPNVTVTTSATSDVVWNTVTLKVEATDNSAINRIELKIDNVSVGTATASPFEFEWNTLNTTDGEHTITGIAKDDSGNEKSVEIKVTVRNILLVADVPDDLLQTNGETQYQSRGFIFLSDDKGKVIVAQEFQNGDHIELKAPAFTGSEFFVTEAQTKYYDGDVELTTTEKISRGTSWILSYMLYNSETSEPVGHADLTFTNNDESYEYEAFTNYSSWYQYAVSNTASELLNFSPSKLLIVRTNPETREQTYNLIPSIAVGNTNATIDLSQVTKPMTVETKDLPAGLPYAWIVPRGLRAADNNTEFYNLSNYNDNEDGTVTTRYPADAFPAYYSTNELAGDGPISAFNRSMKPYDIVPLNATIDATYSNGKLTVPATGTMDFYVVYINSGFSQFWTFYGNKSTGEIIVPEIPGILTDLVSNDLSESHIWSTAFDYAAFDGYDGLLTFIKESELGKYELGLNPLTEVKSITNEPNNGERQSSGKRPKRGLAGRVEKRR